MSIVISGPTAATVTPKPVTQPNVSLSLAGLDLASGVLTTVYGQQKTVQITLLLATMNTIRAAIQAQIETDQGWVPGSSTIVIKVGS
jgi:hypothetical protein